jgi:threonine dehydrogenase-like Zn-dependent dehydrogenase
LRHTREFVETSRESGQSIFVFDVDRDVVMGHEFSAHIVEPASTKFAVGDPIVAFPIVAGVDGPLGIGFSNEFPGGYGERMVLTEGACLPVPNGLDMRHAALTEPMAVGLHTVNQSAIQAGKPAVVLGCGPVGLAIIASLALRQVEPIVAADFSPKRRKLALTMGAHEVVDPREESAVDAWRRIDSMADSSDRVLVIFEAVGVPGMIESAMREAPRLARIVVVGLCMETDHIKPTMGVNKELLVQFVLGWSPEEFAASLRSLAEGKIDAAPLITGEVGIAEVPSAFEMLADPDGHAKILVRPDLG